MRRSMARSCGCRRRGATRSATGRWCKRAPVARSPAPTMPLRWEPRSRRACVPAARTEHPHMRVVLTRPAQDAVRWSSVLATRGHQVIALPLIEIAPLSHERPLSEAWAGLPGYQAVMFVSANAVLHFQAAGHGASWPATTQAWATGPGTAAALREAGVPEDFVREPAADAAQLDSEALWARVGPQVRPGWRVLVVRGAAQDGAAAGRDWLGRQLQNAGAHADQVAAYVRIRPRWTDAE